MSSSRRFLIDQMFDRLVVATLREQDYEVVAVSELGMATADDAEIMRWAIEHDRIVVTLDEHFGDWSILPLSRHPGVIRLKVNPATTAVTLGLLLPFLQRHAESDFRNRLVIVRESGIRWIKTGE
jgi:predicted nuclease of predicted toxin-antitoxin system